VSINEQQLNILLPNIALKHTPRGMNTVLDRVLRQIAFNDMSQGCHVLDQRKPFMAIGAVGVDVLWICVGPSMRSLMRAIAGSIALAQPR